MTICFAVNSILYQRGIYPADDFTMVKKYGMSLLVCQQEQVKGFIDTNTKQIATWLETGNIQRVVMVIASMSTKEVLERWNFIIENDQEVLEKGYGDWTLFPGEFRSFSQSLWFVDLLAMCSWNRVSREKSDKDIRTEIQGIIRQIVSSVTFLPNIEDACTFDMLAYTSVESEVRSINSHSSVMRILHS